MHDDDEGTTSVRFEVLGVEMVRAGRVLALANVSVEIEGGGFTIQGARIVRGRAGGLTVEAPQWRRPRNGRELPAVILPPDLRDAIGAEFLASISTSD